MNETDRHHFASGADAWCSRPARAALADTAPRRPSVIQFWHTRGSGANYEVTVRLLDG